MNKYIILLNKRDSLSAANENIRGQRRQITITAGEPAAFDNR